MYHKTYGTITPLKKRVLVSHMHFGMAKTKGGIILQDDDGSAAGVHSRCAKVYAVGKDQTDVHEGEWVLIAHGRWTRQINLVDPDTDDEFDVRMVDEDDILLVTEKEPDHHYVPGQMHK